MFIAFEGPDNVGKSTTAAALDYTQQPDYNATKPMHAHNATAIDGPAYEQEYVHTYDRIDWFSHMVYRLALPDHEWNDERPRTVFAMPDTHLVVMIHHPDLAAHISDELYVAGKVAQVNPLYYYFTDFFMGLNAEREFALFKTVTMIEVSNDVRAGTFSRRLVAFSSPATPWHEAKARYQASGENFTNDALLSLLRYDDHQRV